MRTYKDDFNETGINCLSLDSLNEAMDNLLTQIPALPACNAATIGFIDLDLNCWVPDLKILNGLIAFVAGLAKNTPIFLGIQDKQR